MIVRKRVVDDRVVHEGYWRVRRVVMAAEQDAGALLTREIVEARDASVVLLFDAARDVVMLIRQFRPATFVAHEVHSILEACAGVFEPGEDALACAIREAREETGVAIGAPRFICRIYPSPGVCTERLNLFIAEYSGVSRLDAGGGLASEQEEIEPIEIPLAQALRMIDIGEIIDAKTIILLQRLAAEIGATRSD